MNEQEIEAMKRNIDVQLDEYEADLAAFAAWMRDWEQRQPKGFRAVKRRA